VARQIVEFYSDRLKLRGELFSPDEPGLHPAIVFCHGYGGTRETFLNDFAAQFQEWGYACLAFDYRGFGASAGERGRLIPLEQVADIRNAVTFIEQQPGIDTKRIAVYGISFGGGHAVYVAGVDERVACMVSVVGFGDGARWMRSLRRYWEWRDFMNSIRRDRVQRVLTGKSTVIEPNDILIRDPEAAAHEEEMRKQFPERKEWLLTLETADTLVQYSPESVVDRIAPRPALFIGVSEDCLIPVEEQTSLFARAGEPKRLVVLDGLGHHDVYYGDNLPFVLSTARDWLDTHLRSRTGTG
jgi:pimeloyl-ACP methyl ester carboxylesterase